MSETSTENLTLEPNYRLCGAIALLGLPLYFVSVWALGAVELFAVFLSVQAATLRLVFGETSLTVFRRESIIRDFPYAEWLHWEIFWSPVPILFYFREVKSIHFLPIIFSPTQLRTALESRVPLTDLQENAAPFDPTPQNK
ncbi:MAG: DUF3119 family protein [Cyanobacteria bacterium J06639_1]